MNIIFTGASSFTGYWFVKALAAAERAGLREGAEFRTQASHHSDESDGRLIPDVVLDLRKDSATFGRSYARELSAANREMFFIPVGFAHGFLALEADTTTVYQTSTVHSPAQDTGIAWNSFGFDWPVKNPVMSERDHKFPALHDFASPF